MLFFLLPKTYLYTYKNIKYSSTEYIPHPAISNSLSYYLTDIKEKIKIYENEWDIYKKYLNPYEYINSIIPGRKKCVSKYKPLSRSYFKMIEILNHFSFFPKNYQNGNFNSNNEVGINSISGKPIHNSNNITRIDMNESMPILVNEPVAIRAFHLAEGPGGFIEALVHYRNNPNDLYVGMTIRDNNNDNDIPGWKKSKTFLKNNPNVFIEDGDDKTGDILKLANFVYCKNKYGSSMDLITADGGFDFSIDFNNQEINVVKLLFAQIAFALCMQKKGGSFILKIFDVFMEHTVDLLYLLSSFYEKVYITKPQTSRYANSEKYIICKKFLFNSNADFYPYLYNAFYNMINNNNFTFRFLNCEINSFYITKLEEFNSIFGQQQTENIYGTISLIETKNKVDKIDILIKQNVQKCINWCIKNNVYYNSFINNYNLFLSNSNNMSEKYYKSGNFTDYSLNSNSDIFLRKEDNNEISDICTKIEESIDSTDYNQYTDISYLETSV